MIGMANSSLVELSNDEMLSVDGGWSLNTWGNVLLIGAAMVGAAAIAGPVGVIVGVGTAIGGGIVVGTSK